MVLAEAKGNLLLNYEACGGKIVLTNKRFFFHPHKWNLTQKSLMIDNEDITNVQKANTFFLIPNGIIIYVKNQGEYKFAIQNRNFVF